jgi:hypothetical protein
MHVEASTQITHRFAEAENQTFLLFVNVKKEKYDSSSKQVKIIGFLFSTFRVSRKNKFMLSCVREYLKQKSTLFNFPQRWH